MRILLVDNFDSFTWNIQHLLVSAGVEVEVIRNDVVNPQGIMQFDGVILSPGPGLPKEAGQLMQILPIAVAHRTPLLGVCLGMQAIAEHFGGTLQNLNQVLHGQQTRIIQFESVGIFESLKAPFEVGHYHSWIVNEAQLPSNLKITAWNDMGLPMALMHQNLPIQGVQFHPESVLTPVGQELLNNWIQSVAEVRLHHPAKLSGIPVVLGEGWSKKNPHEAGF